MYNPTLYMIYYGDVVATVCTLVACQTSEAEVPGSNPASPTMILGPKKYTKKKNDLQ